MPDIAVYDDRTSQISIISAPLTVEKVDLQLAEDRHKRSQLACCRCTMRNASITAVSVLFPLSDSSETLMIYFPHEPHGST